ncbi:hypothetical protein [uncultured Carboxylicivirga sp.]|uniref:hypothetical protein n=2 Tax=Carboxylicivirga TaxID=1628153 RepID=UPI0025969CF9|nr:hypothetical protein [uncultured Carboxylicivirga sp.]
MISRINCFMCLIVLLVLASFVSYQQSSIPLEEQLDAIFECDRFKVTIPHHGGYAASIFGKGILRLQRQKSDSTYLVCYKDAIDKRKLEFTIDEKEYCKFKDLFLRLIDIHNPSKKLSGNCLTIDHNYILEATKHTLVIKPDKGQTESNCLINWIYNKELNN